MYQHKNTKRLTLILWKEMYFSSKYSSLYFIYNLIVSASWFVLKLVGKVNLKISLFVNGRKHIISTLRKNITKEDKVIWIHAASLGEYEQGLPIMEQLKLGYPNYKLLVTFFSPSGYEVRKNTSSADAVTYLPLDTKKKVNEFLDATNPRLAIFIKYEIWPNYLLQLSKRQIPTLLVSALFKPNQIYFKSYGRFMRNALQSFNHFYLQNDDSKKLLSSIGIQSATITGDTRLDRVLGILEADNRLEFMETFSKNTECFVAGSTWPEDENLLVDYINSSTGKMKFVIAPHNINKEHIIRLEKAINKPTVKFTELNPERLLTATVLIIDTIGILTKIYSYANIAYVGGGFTTGLHNTLEPAVFGIPVIIGPNYSGFVEAEELVALGGIISVANKEDFIQAVQGLASNITSRNATGMINAKYIAKNKGATTKIMHGIKSLLID